MKIMACSPLYPKLKLLTFVTYIFVLLYPLNLSAQTFPDLELQDWSNAGFPGDLPDPSLEIHLSDYMPDYIPGDYQDYSTFDALKQAINALEGRAGVILIPQGEFVFTETIQLPDSCILRGEGAGLTILKFDFEGQGKHCIEIKGKTVNDWASCTQAPQNKSALLSIQDSTSWKKGDWIELRQANGDWDTSPAAWAEYSVGHISRIDSVAENGYFLEDPLRIDFDLELLPEAQRFLPAHQIGIECLTIEREDYAESGLAYNIYFRYATDCWVKGVESNFSVGSHIMIESSARISAIGNYLHDAFVFNGSGTRGYGITLIHHSNQILIENNIMEQLRHAMMVKQGANGNVFAYNYSRKPKRVEFPTDLSADISLHGHYPFANLFEGNVVQNIIADHFWGPSGPGNIFFRNIVESYGIITSNFIAGAEQTDGTIVIANELSGSIPKGQLLLGGGNDIRYGNSIRGKLQRPSESEVEILSLYREQKPLFWPSGMDWPGLGTPYLSERESLPAYARYVNDEDKAICNLLIEDEDSTGIITSLIPEVFGEGVNIFPNPFRDIVIISQIESTSWPLKLTFYDLLGKKISSIIVTHAPEGTINLKNLADLPLGINFLQISNPKGVISTHKLIKK